MTADGREPGSTAPALGVVDLGAAVSPAVDALIDRLVGAGHAAYLVGGSLRDLLLDRPPADWDMATDARPDRLVALLPGAVYENRFGTVAVRRDAEVFEITTFRFEHDYADFRRPHRVEFGDEIESDLARRDFTVNALAWGRRADDEPNALVDPFGGREDLAAGVLRAVGDPDARFREDALRMVRAVRLAGPPGRVGSGLLRTRAAGPHTTHAERPLDRRREPARQPQDRCRCIPNGAIAKGGQIHGSQACCDHGVGRSRLP